MNIHEYDYSSRFKSLSKARVFMTCSLSAWSILDILRHQHFLVYFGQVDVGDGLCSWQLWDVGDRFLCIFLNFLAYSSYGYPWLNTVIHSSPVVSRCIICKSPIWSNSTFALINYITWSILATYHVFSFSHLWITVHFYRSKRLCPWRFDLLVDGLKSAGHSRVHLSNNNLLSF